MKNNDPPVCGRGTVGVAEHVKNSEQVSGNVLYCTDKQAILRCFPDCSPKRCVTRGPTASGHGTAPHVQIDYNSLILGSPARWAEREAPYV